MDPERRSRRHYFVDEAGDGTLFSRRGRVLIGSQGCSRFFILGLADIPGPLTLGANLAALRSRLLADPYFKDVPSMQPERGRTAVAFHATDDPPEVRREVFSELLRHEMRFFAVVKDKAKVLDYVRSRNSTEPTYRYHPNELYDYLVRRLFRDRLHKDDSYQVCFARRGSSDRTAALDCALQAARQRFTEKHGKSSTAPIDVAASVPARSAGLQAVDYFLWSLQRLYEREEDRFLLLLWPRVSLVHDLDDKRKAQYGTYFAEENPLTRESKRRTSGI